MDIDKILQDLGIDLSNPEARRGAIDAIDAILSSREPPIDLGGGAGGGGAPIDVEIDPDLIQPSPKHQPPAGPDAEIEDPDDVLSKMKTKDQEEHVEPDNEPEGGYDSELGEKPTDKFGNEPDGESSGESDGDDVNSGEETGSDNEEGNVNINSDEKANVETEGEGGTDGTESGESSEDSDEDGDPDVGGNRDYSEEEEESAEQEESEEAEEDESILDQKLQGIKDKDLEAKSHARRIKRERTLAAAKKTLEKAKANNAPKALIKELEDAIATLEALTEAAKHIDDLSDAEFNTMVNRVFDAIDAIGGSGLTYSSAADRAKKVKEIKDDIESAETQHELSAEDAEIIRTETQAVRARQKDAEKYKTKSRDSFKGFQDFLTSLKKAIALQVKTNSVRDSSWSALSRRNSGVGVLQQGKRIKELPDRKVPIIDFYFDYSTSWNSTDLAIGKKAAEALTKMEEDGDIIVNRYYFGNYVANAPNRSQTGGGTSGWNEIVKNVIATGATNVIIMTDDDMERWWSPQDRPPLAYTVQGYVWYLWKNGVNAPRLPRDLKGRGGVQQFSFCASDVN